MKKLMVITCVAALFAWGCDDNYFTDGGVLDERPGVLGVSTMDYLESRRELFDTLATLIRLCGLEEAVNRPGSTFLAPQDYAIHNFFELAFPNPDERPATLAELPEELLAEIAEIIKNYIIPNEAIVRTGLSTAYSHTETLGGKKARFNLVRGDYLGNVNMGASVIVFSLDVSGGIGRERYQSVHVVTSDLQSTNGIIQILRSDTHIFGFN
ncbi:fasciclin domain-containing protein [Parapedobacter deserti]|uniref:Fasciclin domain-containing protein n=1 Tax=Parapedobacter deserti TaxID=1912957 RepID=A0ABV7JPK1_9SPHI